MRKYLGQMDQKTSLLKFMVCPSSPGRVNFCEILLNVILCSLSILFTYSNSFKRSENIYKYSLSPGQDPSATCCEISQLTPYSDLRKSNAENVHISLQHYLHRVPAPALTNCTNLERYA